MSSHPLIQLLSHTRRHQTRIWQASLCSVLNKIFDLAPPLLIGVAVDVVVQGEDSFLARWGIGNVTQQLILLSVLSFVIWSLESLFEYLYDRLWRNSNRNVETSVFITEIINLKTATYGHLA